MIENESTKFIMRWIIMAKNPIIIIIPFFFFLTNDRFE